MESRSERRRRRLARRTIQSTGQRLWPIARTTLFWLIGLHALASVALVFFLLILGKTGGMAISDGLADLPILACAILTLVVFLVFPSIEVSIWIRGTRAPNGNGVSDLNRHANNA